MKYEFVCEDCEASYDIVHNEDSHPAYCPFCGWNNMFDSDQEDEEAEDEWDDQDRDRF